MALSANFSSSQNYGNITIATFTDTSTGSDGTITGRRIYLAKYNGSYLVPTGTSTDYVDWVIGDTSIDIDVLDKDYAILVTVDWMSGSTITYTKTVLCLFTAYGELFLRQLTQAEAANRNLLNNKNFWSNKQKLRTLIDDSTQAVSVLNDQTIATFCLTAAKDMTDNPSIFY